MIRVAKLFESLSYDRLKCELASMKVCGVTQVYLRAEQLFHDDIYTLLKQSGLELWLIAPIFYHDENKRLPFVPRWAIDEHGEEAHDTQEHWLSMVCPSDMRYLSYRCEQLREILQKYPFHGISLDFIRYFVFWEGVYPDTDASQLRNTCFCPVCRARFCEWASFYFSPQEDTAVFAQRILQDYASEWTAFKSTVIDESVQFILRTVQRDMPGIRSNLHVLPWTEDDFDGAMTRIAGQDLSRLAPLVDYITPLCYHQMLRRSPEWIRETMATLAAEQSAPLITAIQSAPFYGYASLDLDEFEAACIAAQQFSAAGMAVWPWEQLTDVQKEILQKDLHTNDVFL